MINTGRFIWEPPARLMTTEVAQQIVAHVTETGAPSGFTRSGVIVYVEVGDPVALVLRRFDDLTS